MKRWQFFVFQMFQYLHQQAPETPVRHQPCQERPRQCSQQPPDRNNGPIGPPQSNGNFSTNGQAGQGQVDATLCTNFTGALGGSPKLKDLFDFVTCMIIRSIIPLVFGIAILIFIWGVVQFIGNGDNEEKRKEGKTFMIWGIIAITVMVSIWGFVAMLGKSFGVDNAIPRLAEPKNP